MASLLFRRRCGVIDGGDQCRVQHAQSFASVVNEPSRKGDGKEIRIGHFQNLAGMQADMKRLEGASMKRLAGSINYIKAKVELHAAWLAFDGGTFNSIYPCFGLK